MTGQVKTKLKKNGLSMVEVLIALLLLGIVSSGFLAVLANSSSHTITADVRATAESIARSQMESIKAEESYQADASLYDTILVPPGWTVAIAGETRGTGLQKVLVTVSHNGQDVLTLEGYKAAG